MIKFQNPNNTNLPNSNDQIPNVHLARRQRQSNSHDSVWNLVIGIWIFLCPKFLRNNFLDVSNYLLRKIVGFRFQV